MEKFHVDLGDRGYPIYIGSENLKLLGKKLRENFPDQRKILLATDANVDKIYTSLLQKNLEKSDFEVTKIVVSPGEATKNLEKTANFFDRLVENNFARDSIVLSLGGGVVGDLAGFAAATYMRGINFIQVPTSLLAQVDSSVGGKVAVNHPQGKNLIGAFYQPEMVYMDVSVLKTLPDREFKAGMAEVIKHGFGLDEEYFKYIKNHSEEILSYDYKVLTRMILRSCQIKKKIVEQDEKEKGERAKLNLGHTIAHALETVYDYNKINHGEAVALGMVVESYLAKYEGIIDQNVIDELVNLLKSMELPISLSPGVSGKNLIKMMQSDKKIRRGKVQMALPQKIGSTVLFRDWSQDKLLKAIKTVTESNLIE